MAGRSLHLNQAEAHAPGEQAIQPATIRMMPPVMQPTAAMNMRNSDTAITQLLRMRASTVWTNLPTRPKALAKDG